MLNKVLIAGATGALGQRVAVLAQNAGLAVRGLSRRAPATADAWVADACEPGALRGCCDGVDTVFSALGASVRLQGDGRRPFSEVDSKANLLLLEEAVRAGVRRFVYVAAYTEPGYAWTKYIQAHEEVVRAVRRSGLSSTIIRPTAFFSSLDPYLSLARKGLIPLIGDGEAKTNPIDVTDLAELVIGSLYQGPPEISAGGPETMSRRKIGSIAFEALRVYSDPSFIEVPPVLARMNGKLLGLYNPRLGELVEFAAAVSITNCIAPRHGSRKLLDYFRSLAAPAA